MEKDISPEEVTDRKSFIKFCNSLRNEFDSNNDAWENNTLSAFLEALEAYANGIQGYYNNIHPGMNADIPTWRTFATILKGASIYE
jgi:hypothetical protein